MAESKGCDLVVNRDGVDGVPIKRMNVLRLRKQMQNMATQSIFNSVFLCEAF